MFKNEGGGEGQRLFEQCSNKQTIWYGRASLTWLANLLSFARLFYTDRYGEEDLAGAKSLVDQCPPDDTDTEINLACLLYKEGRYSEALAKFSAAQQMIGYDAHLSYNTALCHYRLKDFAPALKNIADIIERGIREHPELSVGMQTEGIEVYHIHWTLQVLWS